MDTNEAVRVWDLDGLTGPTLRAALMEMEAVGSGSRSRKPLYHASINIGRDEAMTEAQKVRAIDRLGDELGLTGQPRAIVEHVKEGREHLHVVWSRIDGETLTTIRDSHNYRKHEIVARELEREFGLQRVQGVHIEREGIERPARTPEPAEMMAAARTGLKPAEAKAEITGLWHQADSGRAFADALDDAGWTLARGDKRDFVVLDRFGEVHSLGRRVEGVKAAEVRARMADIDAAALPNVDEARQAMQERQLDAAQPVPVLVPEMGGADIPAQEPEATQRPSYEAVPELPPDLDARFEPTMPEAPSNSQQPPIAHNEPPYVPNFVMVVDMDAMMDARFGVGPQIDPDAGMVIDAEPEPLQQLDEWAELEAENTPQHRQAKSRQMQEPEPEAQRRQEPAHGSQPSAADADARRAMEELARTAPLGMAARHGFHAGDRLKTPEDMRREMAERMRGFAADPQPDPSPDLATRDLETERTPQREPAPKPTTLDLGRLARVVAAARDRLADLAHRLDVAFGRVRDQMLGHEAASPSQPTPEPLRPKPTPERVKSMDDNGAVILEAMKQPPAEPKRSRSVAEELLEAGRRHREQNPPKPDLDLDRDLGQRRRRMPWEPPL